jgi:3-oxoacyl-[acyl-carrier protein] reductase
MAGVLDGKVAVVTGAARGIGAGIAREFGTQGAAVVVDHLEDPDAAQAVVTDIEAAGGRAIAIAADVTDAEDVDRLFTAAIDAFGGLDIIVNNAAIYIFEPIDEVDEAGFLRHFRTNVLGDILTTQAALKRFGAGGGSIINLTSQGAVSPPANSSVYSATKGAINSLTLELARELGPRGVRVNALACGATYTEGAAKLGVYAGSALAAEFEAATPLGRLGTPQDIGKAAVFLASDDAAWISGEIMKVTGGMS